MKTALVHDYLAQSGGAERVVEQLRGIYPDAPLYTSVYDRKSTLSSFESAEIVTSFLQRWPMNTKRLHKFMLPLYPMAFERFNFTGYDLVVSSSSSFAKGVITPPETLHVCYCHTPARFAWRQQEYLSQSGSQLLMSPLFGGLMTGLRSWDVTSSHRVDFFIANSQNIARRIRKYYRRQSVVVYPPVNVGKFYQVAPESVGDSFLVVSRLVSYKRIDLAIRACNALRLPLKVIGVGPELACMRQLAGPTVEVLGWQSDEQVVEHLAHCRALIFPGDEDFGITPVECMASGRPVVAYAAGGALETVEDEMTGVLFAEQTVECLCEALEKVRRMSFDPAYLRRRAARFDVSVFRERFAAAVALALEEHRRDLQNDRTLSKSFDYAPALSTRL